VATTHLFLKERDIYIRLSNSSTDLYRIKTVHALLTFQQGGRGEGESRRPQPPPPKHPPPPEQNSAHGQPSNEYSQPLRLTERRRRRASPDDSSIFSSSSSPNYPSVSSSSAESRHPLTFSLSTREATNRFQLSVEREPFPRRTGLEPNRTPSHPSPHNRKTVKPLLLLFAHITAPFPRISPFKNDATGWRTCSRFGGRGAERSSMFLGQPHAGPSCRSSFFS
jgi:hypothetical protein